MDKICEGNRHTTWHFRYTLETLQY